MVLVTELGWRSRVAVAAARRAVAEADFYATVADVASQRPQGQVASLLRTSQPQVSRWAAKGRSEVAAPGRVARTAYEVVQRYAVGVLSREQMLEALVGWPYEPSPPVEVAEWDLAPAAEPAGSFEATVGRAHDEGLLSGADYDAVLDALADDELSGGTAPVEWTWAPRPGR